MGVGAAVAAFFVMWGSFLYMSAAGSHQQMDAEIDYYDRPRWVLHRPAGAVVAGMIQDSIGASL